MKIKWFGVLLGALLSTTAFSQSLKPDNNSWRNRIPGAEGTLGVIGSPHISIVYDRSGSYEYSYILSAETASGGGCAGRRWVIWRYEAVSNAWTKYHEFPMHNSDSSCASYTLLGGGSLAKFGTPGNIRLGVAYAIQVERSPNEFQTEVHYYQESTGGVFPGTPRVLTGVGAGGTSFAVRGTAFVGQYVSLDFQRPTNYGDALPGIALGLADYYNQDIINLGLGHSMAYVYYFYSTNAANTSWGAIDVAAWRDSGPCLQPPGGLLNEGFIDCERFAGVGGISLDMDMSAPLNERARIAYSRVQVPNGSVLPVTDGSIKYWDRESFEVFPLQAFVALVESGAGDTSSAAGHATADSGYEPFMYHQPVSLALDPATNYPYIAYSLVEFTGDEYNEMRAVMPTGAKSWNPPEVVASQSHGPPTSSPFYIPFVADASSLWVGDLMVDGKIPSINNGRVQLIMSAHGQLKGDGAIALFRRALVNPPGGGPAVVAWERDAIIGGGIPRPPSAALDPVTGRPVTAYYRENLQFTIDEIYWSDGGSLFITSGLPPVVTGPTGVTIQLDNKFGVYTASKLPPGNYTISVTRTCQKGGNQTCVTNAVVQYGLPTLVTCIPPNCTGGTCGTIPFPGESLAYSARAATLPLLPALAALMAWAVVRRRKVA